VEMVYSNDLVKFGGAVSATAVALLAIIGIIPRRRERDVLAAYDEPLHLVASEPAPPQPDPENAQP